MNFNTDNIGSLEPRLISNYFESLKGQFFKILPMTENREPSRFIHIDSFLTELMGADSLIDSIHCDARFLSLIAVLKYFSDHPDLDAKTVRREVFKACTICDTLAKAYSGADKGVS